ncbi:MAG: hypothetical protein ISR82_07830 [Candidatus Marinimicrobia bacterium]|nr:hypothetical protein [Candidatus Neomarinimicrobiota bacterium]MBL7011117.1 hypothetical protein [Candidatus Neomarinimicrobiota bacterium]MBL7030130.1 hypothetical protein [Candidatus Neomarinimicrobiota bacterium]
MEQKQNQKIVYFLPNLKIFTLLILMSFPTAYAMDNGGRDVLDGKSFKGKMYWDNPWIRWVRFRDTIEFKDGMISSKLSIKSGYKPATYTMKKENGNIIFTARSIRTENDYFEWSGEFDGYTLKNVKMAWTNDGEMRHYIFKQK